MNKNEVTSAFQVLDNGANEIQEVLQLRKEQSLSIALQELKSVLNDSEEDNLTTPFNIDPRCIDLLLGEYQKGINVLQKKYIASVSFENMLERIFSIGDEKDELEGMLEKELVLQEDLIEQTESLEETLTDKEAIVQKLLEAIRKKNNSNFNIKEKEINDLFTKIVEKLQMRERTEEIFDDEDNEDDICDVFDEHFCSVIDAALEDS